MIKLIDILNEVGDASATPYEYEYNKSKYKAYFVTEDNIKYIVYFDVDDNKMKIDFGVMFDDDEDDVDFEIITNKQNVYRIIKTVIDITHRAISDFKPDEIEFSSDPQRIRIYKTYINTFKEYTFDKSKETPFNLFLKRKN